MKQTEQWTSKLGFILAAAGSAIGLGAIWKFPYVAGTSGGGAFFVLFLLFTVLIGLPLLLGEFIIGRSTQREAITAYKTIAPNSGWHWIGRLGVTTCFILLSFYSVVGGWILLYLFRSVTGQLIHETQSYDKLFEQIITNPAMAVGAQCVFMLFTIIVVARGVQDGIEKANKYMMPALFLLFLVLIARSLTLDGAWKGVAFFLQPDFSKLTSETVLYAMGQSFFSLSVGVSVMVTYSSYLARNESLTRSATSIVGLNLAISLLAGLAIFPAVFSLGVEPTAGPGLLFMVLPSVFAKIPFGAFFLTIFLALFLFATLTSAFSMLEIIVAALAKGNKDKRKKATWLTGLAIFVVGIPSALSYGVWSDMTIFGKSIFDASDFLVSNILMPLGALLIAIFVPLRIKRDVLVTEFNSGSNISKRWFAAWLLLIRYVAPIAIIIVFLDVVGVI
ncbi:sodium-dependent transporter [Aneurinibacillus aneurinilyticus]|uniref:Transporter n=1 Tax=Aneurinibacillus aneurinilyticus ATCC 12856 TaxID=649747 RepID=U1YCJ1_ANEAE|nr:sodium-dependent transporter [Aneurinibacillus aneurinilyticus]ERI08531.1 Sodium:neurotransmitter symporter family protein [Aneurinibacillus aneurinilyticus ATCC 12856]MED0704991.1 sodium-dependent transporter [Aneurinibacillus aneurinilyticus]MED0721792.1 sodium-dependent transporter [Aneurinibacillus aneurinilyticus]MED0732750.1 sodium-dependent transporter [Aneurinibacillus aneurinilyticus]MED0742068.1 sodium-dependent transporter [Aneurinibacillus aneurinilyticus]